MFIKIRYSVVFVLLVCFLVALSGCGENPTYDEETLPEDAMSSDVEQTAESLLSPYEAGGIDPMIILLKVFPWWIFSRWMQTAQHGHLITNMALPATAFCYGDESSLTLDLAEFGVVILFPDGENLIDENGKIHFVRGEEPQPQVSQTTLGGYGMKVG